jgi:FMN-dependent NADH-azoreductase
MKKILHIIATPRGEESSTLEVSSVFLDAFLSSHKDWVVDELDLTREALPALTLKRVDGKYVLLQGKDLYGDLKEAWQDIIKYIERFKSADAYLISTPMWNFGVPYVLKQYIDIIVQPKYLFQYTAKGVEGLIKDRKMLVIASRGGDYSSPTMSGADYQESYLRFVFGFVGISDFQSVVAQPMDMGKNLHVQKVQEAQEKAKMIAAAW